MNEARSSIHAVYEDVRSRFFPEWDSQHEWKLDLDTPCEPFLAYAAYLEKTIYVSRETHRASRTEIFSTLVHEIAHVLTQPDLGHQKRWQRVMKRCATIAYNAGDRLLGMTISSDADVHAKLLKPRQWMLDGSIELAVINPEAFPTYDHVLLFASHTLREITGYTAWEWRQAFPKGEKLYESAKTDPSCFIDPETGKSRRRITREELRLESRLLGHGA